MTETVVAPSPERPVLTLFDYCDAGCSIAAQSRVLVQFPDGYMLSFCKHCYEKHEPGLLAQSGVVVDDTRKDLEGGPGVSAAS